MSPARFLSRLRATAKGALAWISGHVGGSYLCVRSCAKGAARRLCMCGLKCIHWVCGCTRAGVGYGWRRVCDWLRGEHWQHTDENQQKHGIAELVTLEAIVLAIAVALIGYLENLDEMRERQSRYLILGLYGLASAVPLVGMVLIQNLRYAKQEKPLVYDRSTIMFARWSILVCFACIAAVAYGYQLLPGQLRHLPLPIAEVQDYKFEQDHPQKKIKKDDTGLDVFAYFCPSSAEMASVPSPLRLNIVLEKPAAGSWEIVGIQGFRVEPLTRVPPSEQKKELWKKLEGNELRTNQFIARSYPIEPDDSGDRNWEAYWRDLKANEMYIVEVRLAQRTGVVTREELKSRIMEDRTGVVKITVKYRD